eukprot:2425847-Prymnesium_polylepis.1
MEPATYAAKNPTLYAVSRVSVSHGPWMAHMQHTCRALDTVDSLCLWLRFLFGYCLFDRCTNSNSIDRYSIITPGLHNHMHADVLHA